MSESEMNDWADKAWADFERKEAAREKRERAARWAQGNGFRQSLLDGRGAAQDAVNERLSRNT